ncbi:polyprenyl synthetase family protein [Streptomyces sp. NPDC020096]
MRSPQETTDAVVAYMDAPLRQATSLLSEPVRAVVEYYYGWIDATRKPTIPVGVRRRPATVMLLCTGSDEAAWQCARNAATACSLMEGASIIHDDIQDNDTLRNGRPTAWAAFGVPAAIQAGVAMVALSFELLANEPPHIAAEVIRLNALATRELCSGQLRDMHADRNLQVSLSDALAVKAHFAGVPSGCLTAIAALCRNAPPHEVEAARRLGHHAGMAFALFDDWEGIWSASRGDLEEDLSDLRQRKITPCVAYALQTRGLAREQLAAYYQATAVPEPDELLLIRSALQACGSRDWLAAQIRAHVHTAQKALDNTVPHPAARAEIAAYFDLLQRHLP